MRRGGVGKRIAATDRDLELAAVDPVEKLPGALPQVLQRADVIPDDRVGQLDALGSENTSIGGISGIIGP